MLVRGLRKTYDRVEVVGGIDLRIDHGEIFAFLGPNGAGKTTVIEILEGFRQRSGGEVSVLGSIRSTRLARGVSVSGLCCRSRPRPRPDGPGVAEALRRLLREPMEADTVLALVGLGAQGAVIATKLSGGQRRRLDFGLALIGDPDLIFLDEPTTGFDPAARRAAWDAISRLDRWARRSFSPPTTWKRQRHWQTASR